MGAPCTPSEGSTKFPEVTGPAGEGARAGLACTRSYTSPAPMPGEQSWRTMTPSRRPAPGPQWGRAGGNAPQSTAPSPTSRPPWHGEAPGNFAQRRRATNTTRPRVPVQLPAQSGRAAAHGETAHVRPPPPDKGAPAGPEGRAWAARGPGPSPRARPACPYVFGALAEAACVEYAVKPRLVGSARPATSAGAATVSSSCGGRHVPSPSRAPDTPTPRSSHGPPRPAPQRIPPPSPPPRQSPSAGLPSRTLARSPYGVAELGVWEWGHLGGLSANGAGCGRDYLPARRRTWIGCKASMTQGRKDREMER